jgi:hypothetical protein
MKQNYHHELKQRESSNGLPVDKVADIPLVEMKYGFLDTK